MVHGPIQPFSVSSQQQRDTIGKTKGARIPPARVAA
jgi:hypothetical protein